MVNVMGRGKLGLAALVALLFAAVAQAGSVAVPESGWDDSRSTEFGEIFATPDWDEANGGFKIAWDITKDINDIFTYSYTITNSSDGDLAKELSHWILQITDGAVIGDFDDFSLAPENGDPKVHTEQQGNPGMPADVFGLKFEPDPAPSTLTVSFTTDRSPVYGDFYAKDGKVAQSDTIAYNTNFGTMSDQAVGSDFSGWIARPNGPTLIVPVPAAAWMGLGLFGVMGMVKKFKSHA